jgi:hypothetical protein
MVLPAACPLHRIIQPLPPIDEKANCSVNPNRCFIVEVLLLGINNLYVGVNLLLATYADRIHPRTVHQGYNLREAGLKKEIPVYIQTNPSSGASGAGAATSFPSSASASAGSNALTTGTLYAPSSGVLGAPAGVRAGMRAGPSATFTITAMGVNAVLVSAVTRILHSTEGLAINYQRQFPSLIVSFNLPPRASLSTAISDLNNEARKLNFPARGLLLSHVITLHNNPVIYIFFDWLGQLMTGLRISQAPISGPSEPDPEGA